MAKGQSALSMLPIPVAGADVPVRPALVARATFGADIGSAVTDGMASTAVPGPGIGGGGERHGRNRRDQGEPDHAGRAPGVPHFANFPLASLHRFGLAGAVEHLTNLPFASRHGAARAGVASIADAANAAIKNFTGLSLASRLPGESTASRLHPSVNWRHNSFSHPIALWSHR